MTKLIQWQEIGNSRVILRLDLNVPLKDNTVESDFRISKSLPVITELLSRNNQLIILSHLGRPSVEKPEPSLSLRVVCEHLSKMLHEPIKFVDQITDQITFGEYKIIMFENMRFFKGEVDNDPELAKVISSHGDFFVFDAFGVSHRQESSTTGLMNFLDYAAGPLIQSEVSAAKNILEDPKKPLCTIISGAKISTKISLIETFSNKADYLILGGGLLNTYLHCKEFEVGNSLIERDLQQEVVDFFESDNAKKIIMPIDLVCSSDVTLDNPKIKNISMLQSSDKVLDIGTRSIERYADIIKKCSTVFWNGPLGYVEKKPYDKGTESIINVLADSNCFSVIGGGDTVSVIENMGVEDKISYISTGGGALLKYIEGKDLTVIKKLGL
tara:strand:+ start:86 stop:1237 length:1152 start_codon:yes stop_codon:yes gene_type:complete